MHVVREFPLSRRFRAFDLAVSAAGYNSFHELLRFGIPTLFIPNQDTALDDQQGRAQFAADRGTGSHARAVSAWTPPLRSWVICWSAGTHMVANVPSVDRGNGAAAAAMHLRKLAEVRGRSWLRIRCKQLSRLARRMPGYRWVRRRAVPRIRQSATAAQRWPTACFRASSNGSAARRPHGSGRPVASRCRH